MKYRNLFVLLVLLFNGCSLSSTNDSTDSDKKRNYTLNDDKRANLLP